MVVGAILFFGLGGDSTLSAYIPAMVGGGVSGFVAKNGGFKCGVLVGVSQLILFVWGMCLVLGHLPSGKAFSWLVLNAVLVIFLGGFFGLLGQRCRTRLKT